MQASQILEIVIVTLIFSDVVPQLKYTCYLPNFHSEDLSVALLHLLITLFSFQGARAALPAKSAPFRFRLSAQASFRSLASPLRRKQVFGDRNGDAFSFSGRFCSQI